MNAETHDAATKIAKHAGAIIRCQGRRINDLYAGSEEAEDRAYIMATSAWRDGEWGFRGMTLEEVKSATLKALTDANPTCPTGNEYRDD